MAAGWLGSYKSLGSGQERSWWCASAPGFVDRKGLQSCFGFWGVLVWVFNLSFTTLGSLGGGFI